LEDLKPPAKEVYISNVMQQKVSLQKHSIENYYMDQIKKLQEKVIWSILIEKKM